MLLQREKNKHYTHSNTKNYSSSLVVLIMLFFMWGFLTCMNDMYKELTERIYAKNRRESANLKVSETSIKM